MPNVTFKQLALDQYIVLQKKDKRSADKLNKLLTDMSRHPESGIGQVERMKGGSGNLYSRRINKKDRIVYTIEEDGSAVIQQIEGHYEDK